MCWCPAGERRLVHRYPSRSQPGCWTLMTPLRADLDRCAVLRLADRPWLPRPGRVGQCRRKMGWPAFRLTWPKLRNNMRACVVHAVCSAWCCETIRVCCDVHARVLFSLSGGVLWWNPAGLAGCCYCGHLKRCRPITSSVHSRCVGFRALSVNFHAPAMWCDASYVQIRMEARQVMPGGHCRV